MKFIRHIDHEREGKINPNLIETNGGVKTNPMQERCYNYMGPIAIMASNLFFKIKGIMGDAIQTTLRRENGFKIRLIIMSNARLDGKINLEVYELIEKARVCFDNLVQSMLKECEWPISVQIETNITNTPKLNHGGERLESLKLRTGLNQIAGE